MSVSSPLYVWLEVHELVDPEPWKQRLTFMTSNVLKLPF
jgi:hypothetical protein